MSEEGIMENYGNIVGNLERIIKLENQSENTTKLFVTIEDRLGMLDARILKLEAIIAELANVEPTYSMEDLAEIALEQRMNEDRGEDR